MDYGLVCSFGMNHGKEEYNESENRKEEGRKNDKG